MRNARTGFVFLQDQLALTDAEIAAAQGIASRVRRLLDAREAYIAGHGLDPQVYLPQAIWGTPDASVQSRRILSGDPAALNHLRILSHVFSGFRLADMSLGVGKPILVETPSNTDEVLARIAPHPDAWVARYWSIAAQLPPACHISPPPRFGEVGWLVNGKLINHDTAVYLERIALICEALLDDPAGRLELPADRPVRILEIGGGYGGLAHHLKTLWPTAQYFIVDLPESLVFPAIYLSTLWPAHRNVLLEPDTLDVLRSQAAPGFTFVPNFLLPAIIYAGLRFDLVINTLSMSEMAAAQVHVYATAAAEMLLPSGGFFEQNQDDRSVGLLNAWELIAQYFPSPRTLTGRFVPGGVSEGLPHLWKRALSEVKSTTAAPRDSLPHSPLRHADLANIRRTAACLMQR